MKKYKIEKPINFYNLDETYSHTDLFVYYSNDGISRMLEEGYISEVQEGFKEEVEEILGNDEVRLHGLRGEIINKIVKTHKEHSKKRFLEIVEKVRKTKNIGCSYYVITEDDLIKAINEE
jgi:hypothetical protein